MQVANLKLPIYAESAPTTVDIRIDCGIQHVTYLREDKVWELLRKYRVESCPSDWCNCDFDCRACWIRNI